MISVVPVVPQLDDPVVQAGEDPWPLRVERQSLYPGTLWKRTLISQISGLNFTILHTCSGHFGEFFDGFVQSNIVTI